MLASKQQELEFLKYAPSGYALVSENILETLKAKNIKNTRFGPINKNIPD